jgi:hypothetical protein
VWRVDLLEAVAGSPGSLDRAHHHPVFRGWEPGPRCFVEGLAARAVGLGRCPSVGSRHPPGPGWHGSGRCRPGDAEALRQAVPEIMDPLARLLERVKAGQLALAPGDEELTSARIGWL